MGRHWLVINPNTSEAITASLSRAVAQHAPAGTRVTATTGRFGAPVVADRVSFAVAALAVLDAYARQGAGVDGVIVGCFGDPGLAALREVCPLPCVGLAEASFDAVGGPFAVLTAGQAWGPMLREQIATHPCAPLSRGVFTLEVTGTAVAADQAAFAAHLDRLATEAKAAGAETLVLGGAVLAGFAPRLRPARFLDCVEAAARALPHAAGNPGATGFGPGLVQALDRLAH